VPVLAADYITCFLGGAWKGCGFLQLHLEV